MTEEKLLTPEEVAKRLNMKKKTVQLWLRQGRITCVRLGARTWRVREKDLDDFIKEAKERQLKQVKK